MMDLEDDDGLLCPHSAAGRPERFPAKACILAGECGCVYGAEWSRALRLADDVAESVIQGEGIRSDDGRITITAKQIAADPYLDDCLAHLEWRGMATVERGSDGVTVEMRR